jgi:hypothetical protein
MMTDEDHIRFALSLDKNKPFVEAVCHSFVQEFDAKQRTVGALKAEIKALKEENTKYKEAYHDQWYDRMEIEKCWNVIGGYNRKHLELHEAIREYIRNREWNYEENLHIQPLKYYYICSTRIGEIIGVCTSEGAKHVLQEEPGCELKEITKGQFDQFNEACDIPKEDKCTCCKSGYESFPCKVHTLNSNFPPNSTEQKIKGR